MLNNDLVAGILASTSSSTAFFFVHAWLAVVDAFGGCNFWKLIFHTISVSSRHVCVRVMGSSVISLLQISCEVCYTVSQ